MAKNKKYQQVSPETQSDSLKVAKATQRPGQTKEQTKLIAQGIEKGIALYKKQQKEKSRELNRRLHKASKVNVMPDIGGGEESSNEADCRQSLFPWLLLVASWLGFVVYLFMY